MKETIEIIVTILLMLSILYAAYKLAKIPGKITTETLALCIIAIALNLFIFKTLAVTYLIFKLILKTEKNENGNES